MNRPVVRVRPRRWPDGFLPTQVLVEQLIGAPHTPAVLTNPSPALVPLAALTHRLTENASASLWDAALAGDLLIALQLTDELAAEGVAVPGLAVPALVSGFIVSRATAGGPADLRSGKHRPADGATLHLPADEPRSEWSADDQGLIVVVR